jgi:indolepyruvate ferredoxin oxidoreductase
LRATWPPAQDAGRADRLPRRASEAYQGARLAARYRALVDGIEPIPICARRSPKGYHKLLAYKDEYEVARLLLNSRAKAEAAFEGDLKLTYHLAPPLLLAVHRPRWAPGKSGFGRLDGARAFRCWRG